MGSMAERLKDFFDARVVRAIAEELRSAEPHFDAEGFVRDGLSGLSALELTGRGWHLAEALRRHLPEPFPEASEILVRSLDRALPPSGASPMEPFRYLPHVFFVAKYGLEHFEPAMAAQYALTQRFTAEFSIRAFLERYPEATLERLQTWAADPNVHVRRLVSEGTRPRLPWAPRLRAFQKDPTPVLALLERLKDDPERYVQRSVANNLNDIAKDHPDLAAAVCAKWLDGAGKGRAWIVRHALRSLVKKGHPAALRLLGVGDPPAVKLRDGRFVPRTVRIGGDLRFHVVLASASDVGQELLVDYAVHFVKANGEARPKVFKLKKLRLPPRAEVELSGTITFRALTTRTPHEGRHRIELLVNGVPHPLGAFDVRR